MKNHTLVLLLLGAPLVHASGDVGECSSKLRLVGAEYEYCVDHAFIGPAIDTRANFARLFADSGKLASFKEPQAEASPAEPELALLSRQLGQLGLDVTPAEPEYLADGDGSRQQTNSYKTTRLFLDQLLATELPENERKTLAEQRLQLLGQKHPAPVPTALEIPGIESSLGQQFVLYLQGASAFYDGDFNTAQARFEQLQDSPQPWLQETATYMLGRSAMNAAQNDAYDYDGYPDPSKADQPALALSLNAFNRYLERYPQGLYSASAKGLLRRVYALQGDRQRVVEELIWQLEQTDPGKRNIGFDNLLNELGNYVLSNTQGVQDPLFLAAADLRLLRSRESSAEPDLQEQQRLSLSEAQLKAQKPLFAQQPELYGFLLASWQFHAGKNPAKAIALLPKLDVEQPLNNLRYSQQVLRGLALEAQGQWTTAEDIWLQLLPLTNENEPRHQEVLLALAINYEYSKRLEKVFAKDSPIVEPEWRLRLLSVASAKLLRQLVKADQAGSEESSMALVILLNKDLSQGHYRDALNDLKFLPQPPLSEQLQRFADSQGTGDSYYACPNVRQIATVLQKTPNNPRALNCLSSVLGPDTRSVDRPRLASRLGDSPSLFKGPYFDALTHYRRLIANPNVPAADRSYALAAAINCFAPSNYNHCNRDDIAPAERLRWFRLLKSKYADTPIAQYQQYYW